MKKLRISVILLCLIVGLTSCRGLPVEKTSSATTRLTVEDTTLSLPHTTTETAESSIQNSILAAIEGVVLGGFPIDKATRLLRKHQEDIPYYRFLDYIVFSYYYETNTLKIATYGEKTPATPRGAKMGDSKEKIIELYGEPYEISDYGTFRYKIKDEYWSFEVGYEDEVVTGWFISNKPNQDWPAF